MSQRTHDTEMPIHMIIDAKTLFRTMVSCWALYMVRICPAGWLWLLNVWIMVAMR